jgi:cystathionine beta-lyase
VYASTVVFRSLDEFELSSDRPWEGRKPYYGRVGTPTTWALEDAIAALEHAPGCVLFPSGISAVTAALSALLRSGDHVLVADAVYGPTRTFCDLRLEQVGVEVEYYDPLIGTDIDRLFRKSTRAVYLESPGSLTFEVQDVPAIVAAARARGIVTILDNTWATPLYFDALGHGIDVSVQAVTKYIAGHADCMLGAISCRTKALVSLVRKYAYDFGLHAAPDDCYRALRGLRTLAVRLRRHYETGLELARWLATRPEVMEVLHPGLPGSRGYEIWQRDFRGASGLFACRILPTPSDALRAMFDGLQLFGMGYSWGAFESLAIPVDPRPLRTATSASEPGVLVRVHAGLEEPGDLIEDLRGAFERRAGTPRAMAL